MTSKVFTLIMKKYGKCPNCGSVKVGGSNGNIIAKDHTCTRTCSCGFSVTLGPDGEEVKR